MPVDRASPITITAFDWVFPPARGQVRDLRARWALEEVGQPYAVDLLTLGDHKQPPHRARQPFGQVPTYEDGAVTLFETGAIVLHIAEQFGRLLPTDAAGRSRAIGWMFAALNTIEPPLMDYAIATIFEADKPWSAPRLPTVEARVDTRLSELSRHLGEREWLEGDAFTTGDLLMISVLRIVEGKGLVEKYDNLAAYVARGTARPGFKAALADQCAAYADDPPPQAEAFMTAMQEGEKK